MFSLQYFQYASEREAQYFKQYLGLIKSRIDENEDELETYQKGITKRKNEFGKDFDDDDAADYLHDLAYERWESEQLMLKSFVVSVFIFIEDLATQLCIHLQKELEQNFSYKELAGSGLGRSINYLKKLLGKHPISDISTLEQFNVAHRVRNALVHADSILKKEDLPLIRSFLKSNADILSVQEHTRRVTLTYAYAESLLTLLKDFSSELENHWKNDDDPF